MSVALLHAMRAFLAWVALGTIAGACASSDGVTGRSSAAVDTICNESAGATIDGIPAYPFCGNFDVWTNNGVDTYDKSGGVGWIRTETNYGYQCAELALRYFRFKYGITTVWSGISTAEQMCAAHPAGVSVTATPVHGDLMVFASGSCGADLNGGHVAVVDKVNASTIDVVQQNSATSTATFGTACASCFLHAANNHGTNDPCEASTTDGVYCGQTIKLVSGAKDVLYQCVGGASASTTVCANGCITEPNKTDDVCAPIDAGADASPPNDASSPIDASTPNDAAASADASMTTTTSSGGCNAGGENAVAWPTLLVLALLARRRIARS